MPELYSAFSAAASLIVHLDRELLEIVVLSLRVSLTAVAIAALIGLPLGAVLVLFGFPGRTATIVGLNALMGLPPVVVGLFLYLLFSRAGPLGVLGLLFTPTAMIIAQCLLVTPIVAALARQTIEGLWEEYEEQLRSLGAKPKGAIGTLLWEGRFALLTAVLAGFGRASAEVGAVMIVGGNIDHLTRVMTTSIALETSKGNLALALGLGLLLLVLSTAVNGGAFMMKEAASTTHEVADQGAPILPLCLRAVTFEAGGKRLIKEITCTFDAGPISVVIGPNGAGKSLLLRLCHGLLRPTSGRVLWSAPESVDTRPLPSNGLPATGHAAPLGCRQHRLRAGAPRRPAPRTGGAHRRRTRSD